MGDPYVRLQLVSPMTLNRPGLRSKRGFLARAILVCIGVSALLLLLFHNVSSVLVPPTFSTTIHSLPNASATVIWAERKAARVVSLPRPAVNLFDEPTPLSEDHPLPNSARQAELWKDVGPTCVFHGPEHGLFDPNTPRPRFLVTGGAGFIGSHLVKRLMALPNMQPGQVKVIDNTWRGQLHNLQLDDGSWSIRPIDDYCHGDLRDPRITDKFIRGADVVYHLADIVAGVKWVFEHQSRVLHDNLLINTNTLWAARVNGIKQYIYAGTACSFPAHLQSGKGYHYLSEDQTYPAMPESAYGWSKLIGEQEAELAQSDTFQVGLLRFHNVYGPRSSARADSGQVIPSLMQKALRFPDQPFEIWGSGDQYRDFVFVEDVVDALLLVREKGMNKGVIQIGSGHPTTIRDLANALVTVTGKGPAMVPIFNATHPEGDHGRVAVLHRAREILDWRPRTPFLKGLGLVYQWMVKQQQQVKVLVIEIGNARGGKRTWQSLVKHVLQPHNAHLAIAFNEDDPRTLLNDHAQYHWFMPPLKDDWSSIFDRAASTCRPPDQVQLWHRLCDIPSQFLGALSPCASHPASSGILWSMRWWVIQHLLRQNLLDKYDYFVLTRADELYLCDHVPFAGLDPSKGHLAEGEGYGGYSDRHLVATAPVFMEMINIPNAMVCDTENMETTLRARGAKYNMEKIQQVWWQKKGLTMSEFQRTMFTVRRNVDGFRWSGGSDNLLTGPFGLKVKYPEELRVAKERCGLDDSQTITTLAHLLPISD